MKENNGGESGEYEGVEKEAQGGKNKIKKLENSKAKKNGRTFLRNYVRAVNEEE